MSPKQAPAHELMGVTNHPEGGWSATCTCGRWGYAGASSKGKLKSLFEDHIKEAGGSRR
jgi:hypothetical protein